MRSYLIDFLIETHAAFALLPETLFLTVNLLDRYCSKRVIYKQSYQLVGCAALLIAAKYGDRKDRVPRIHQLNNLCEIAICYRDLVSTKPSTMARSSRVVLARAILARPDVNDGGWDHAENMTLLTLMHHVHQPSATLARKYSTPNYSRVPQKLAEFMAEQADLARRVASPTTPHTEPISKHTSSIYSTPQKDYSATMGFAGYLTPSITPYGNWLMVNSHNMAKDCSACPLGAR
ncbi:Cyclin N-terminal domain-containing protein [Fusarium sp. LHS14.1]|nr:Cyclin N-terminal domain-containing protein [Fusarium sp. LHS14.1]